MKRALLFLSLGTAVLISIPARALEPAPSLAPQALERELPASREFEACNFLKAALTQALNDAKASGGGKDLEASVDSCPLARRALHACLHPGPGLALPSAAEILATRGALARATASRVTCPTDNDVEVARLTNIASTPAATSGLDWQDSVVRGTAAFVAGRLQSELALALQERLRDNVCSKADARQLLESTCSLFEQTTTDGTSTSAWGTAKAALERDLASLPYNFIQVELGARFGAEAAPILTTAHALVRGIEDGDSALQLLASLRAGDSAVACRTNQLACYLYVTGTIAQTVGDHLDQPIPTDQLQAYARIALQKLQSDAAIHAVLSGVGGEAPRIKARVDAVVQLRRHLEALERLKKLAEKSPDDVKRYSKYAHAVAPLLADVAQIYTGETVGGSCDGKKPMSVGCLKAIGEAAVAVVDMTDAVRAHDYSTAAVIAFSLPKKLNPNATMPAWATEYLPFAAELASAKDAESVQRVLENAAEPVGSYRAKRGSRSSSFTLTLTALPGVQGGAEWLVGRDVPEQNSSAQAGMFAPIGLDFAWGVQKAASVGFLISALDLGALVNFRTEGKTDASPVESEPKVGFAQVVSPGLFLEYGVGGTPIVIGAGGGISPGLRTIQANGREETATAIRFGAFLAADVSIFALVR